MRVAFLVYGVLYVVIEVVGHQLAQVSWMEVTALDVATAVADAFLTVAVLVAVLVAVDVLGNRWHRHVQAARLEAARRAAEEWADPEPITVPSWRPAPLALPAGAPPVEAVRVENAYVREAWPDDAPAGGPRRLL
ncbi:hypothetical protein [Modestobacter versicolor]|uniref:hypothetical protein n=1 Tax=Modestobacter versicolor TaxID=429133 RepID=UPI0034E02E47